jgi:protein-L-isoaspartate O-methyltransferase
VATCGIEQIPQDWIKQLAPRGRLLVPIGDARSQQLVLFTKQGYELVPGRVGATVRFQMMREKPKPGKLKYVTDAV